MNSLPEARKNAARPATVYLVGAGPGDPDLLTIRGRDLLARAELVLFDNLVSAEVLALANPNAELRYVGKKRAAHAHTQAEINQMMVAAARHGRTVVRLKGGDPYVFGRGGEEASRLARAGVPFEVVPGITSALGAAAYAGMPLTHRDHTQAVTFLTGHDVEQVDWKSLTGRQTLVVFMGIVSIAEITSRLIAAGLRPQTPAAAVRWVTRGDQEVLATTLEGLPAEIERQRMRPPALVVIGEIVSLRDEIDWFRMLPLRGQSVVVTRASAQAAGICRQLRRLGARVVPIPTIEFRPPTSWDLADRAIRAMARYDWAVFTSVNGVDRFIGRLLSGERDLRDLPKQIGAIGPATAGRLKSLHLNVELVPEHFVAESLAEAFAGHDLSGARVLIPRAEQAREMLPEHLRSMGAEVDVVPVYRTVLPAASRVLAAEAWGAESPPDWVTVTSSSTVRNLAEIVPLGLLRKSRLVSIGPVTSATAADVGLRVDAQANPYTTDGLVGALCEAAQDPVEC